VGEQLNGDLVVAFGLEAQSDVLSSVYVEAVICMLFL
jgi:hypothetical protein